MNNRYSWKELKASAASVVVVFCLVMSAWEMAVYLGHRRYLRELALEITAKAGAVDNRSKIVALRDYVRAHVTYIGAPDKGRPFLRDSAAETLQSGLGWCGEDTRVFINLAREVGIVAERINLTGEKLHVVAEATISPGETVIVDAQNPPTIADLEPLDKVLLRPDFDDYYTINLRRVGINWLVSRLKIEPGPLTYFLEYPHRIKACLWGGLAALIVLGKALRSLLRVFLLRRGWVHRSSL